MRGEDHQSREGGDVEAWARVIRLLEGVRF